MKLTERVDKIESALLTHLEESGSIRTDLSWLKKAFWTLAIAYIGAIVSNFVGVGVGHGQQNMPQVQQVAANRSGESHRP